MGRRATSLIGNSNDYWNTLALALYRQARTSDDRAEQNEALEEALKAVLRSEELIKGGTVADWYFHAMILAGLGRNDEARAWHERAETRRLAQPPMIAS